MLPVQRIAICLLGSISAALSSSQTFETIDVKPAHSSDPQSMQVRISPDGDLVASSVPVITLISDAYGVPSNPSERLLSVPSWAYGERYDIEAKSSLRVTRIDRKLLQGMFRQVLVERFGLVIRVEDKRMPVYALKVARGGPKLHQSKNSTHNCIFDTARDGCHSFVIGFGHPLNARAIDMDDLAHYIENWTDLPVVNQTGLTGLFSVSTEGWQPMRLPPPPPIGAGNVDFTRLPTIGTVLARLGLELHRQDGAFTVYTVEHIERPFAHERR